VKKKINGKRITIIGVCIFIITASFSVVIAKTDETDPGTSDSSGATSNTGIWYPTMGRFTYSEGSARGTFVHFAIDENTGTISDYTVKLTFHPNVWYCSSSSVDTYPDKSK
jgi:hypothetical protein